MEALYLARYSALGTVYLLNSFFSGDKSNHVPSLHPPQLYYYIAFATIMGWPALISGDSGWKMLVNDVQGRIIGNGRCVLIVNAWCEDLNCSPLIRRMMVHVAVSVAMGLSIKLFTWVRVTLERTPLTMSLRAESTTLFYSRTIDITRFISGDGYSYCTPSYRTCSSRVTSCVHGYGSCVWVRMNASMLIEGYSRLSRARANASADPAPAFMHTSGSTSDTPVGASLLFDPIRANARPACGRTDMGFVVRGILVWVD
jgi:hypothetical protein